MGWGAAASRVGVRTRPQPPVLFLTNRRPADPIGRRRLGICTRLAREEGVAILITTHYLRANIATGPRSRMPAGRGRRDTGGSQNPGGTRSGQLLEIAVGSRVR